MFRLIVALRKESVDRNAGWICVFARCIIVALRKESVDRNLAVWAIEHAYQLVALRKESVDRNKSGNHIGRHIKVALRKESVDRNRTLALGGLGGAASLSARRAWIEIWIDGLRA